jgi:hypothetical protein
MPNIAILPHGCPLKFLGPYGNEWVATPHLDALAAHGVVWDWLYATRPGETPPWIPPQAVWLRNVRPGTPDTPAANRRIDCAPVVGTTHPLEPVLKALPGILDELPSEGWVVVETDVLLPPWHVPQGVFDVYMEELLEASGETDSSTAGPWIDPPEGEFDSKDLAAWEWLHRTVAAAVTTFDADLGRILQIIKDSKHSEETCVIFSAMAGYPLGEHGIVGYSHPVPYEELAHVPLIVKYPQGRYAGERVSALITPDVFSPDTGAWPKTNGVASARTTTEGGQAIRTVDWTLILPGPHLFERPADTFEVNDLSARFTDVVEELQLLSEPTSQ